MALPKNRKPVAARANRDQIVEAIRLASTMQTPGVTPEEGAARRTDRPFAFEPASSLPSPALPAPTPVFAPALPSAPLASAKRIGRPPLKADRTERVSAVLSGNTRDRLRSAMYGESVQRKGKIDQSLIIEEALTAWFDQHGY